MLAQHRELPAVEPEQARQHLSQIIEIVNERFGLDLGEADQLLFDQFEESWVEGETLAAQAQAISTPPNPPSAVAIAARSKRWRATVGGE